jgi:signal transduction histidine kinase/AraC-like DNA-binding protein
MVQNKELQIGDKVNGREILTKNIQYTDSITLTYREPAFTIEFVALNAINPEEIIYSYKLDGFDKDWIHTTAQKRYVTYTNLRQGTYTFLVRAANNIGDWEQQATSLTIRILPPWWETSYALVTFSVLFIGLLFLFRWLILMRARLVHQAKLEHLEREKAEELYQFKMRFFTDISHEFRTPLSLILAPMENILSKVEKDPNTEKQSQIIRKNADRLLRLIEQVMDLRKIDLNKMKLSLSKGDIVAYVRDLTYSFEEIAIQRSMILEFSTDVESLVTWFDENKVEKILGNTLSNAFKFTPDRGKIQVSIQKLPGPVKSSGRHADPLDMNEFIEICIRDNGIGIPDEDKDRLFERFYMVERHDTIVRRGTGIGLALTKELVDLHKGTIRVESKENKGTNIVILLPVISDPAKAGEMVEILPERTKAGEPIQRFASAEDHEYIYKYTHQKNLAHHDKKKPILLLVEDEAEVRAFIRENFESDFQIYEAADGKTGLEIAIRNDPDIIISDIIMPRMDGVEMCQKLKSDLRTSHIPLILLTARSSMESKMEGLGTGADAYLEKPFSLDLLKMQVGNILDNRKILRNKFSKELVLKPSEIAITPVDAQFLQKAIDIVEKHMADPDFGSDAFCHEIGMSRSQLHRKLKGLTSQPASEFIRTMRLERAVRLLEQSQLSIEEISMNVGFNSPAYFSKCFKNHFGKTPSEHAGRQ